ncbi:MAG: hypothetical protein PVF24_09225 [Desulfobacterales bacterium]|jgi:hypothetical protein
MLRKKNDICRFGIKWNKKKEENKRRDLNLIWGRKYRSGIKHIQTAHFKTVSECP